MTNENEVHEMIDALKVAVATLDFAQAQSGSVVESDRIYRGMKIVKRALDIAMANFKARNA